MNFGITEKKHRRHPGNRIAIIRDPEFYGNCWIPGQAGDDGVKVKLFSSFLRQGEI